MSLHFGPTTNLAVTDTPQLGNNAATDVAIVVAATATNAWTGPAIPLTSAGAYEITTSFNMVVNTFAANDKVTCSAGASGSGSSSGGLVPTFDFRSNASVAFSHSASFVTSGAGPWQLNPTIAIGNGANNVTFSNIMVRVTVIKR